MAAKRRQEERSEASVAKVLDAALHLFSTQGYRATALREVAERAGISVGNIYHHFPDKAAIYDRLIERYWERLLDPELRLNRVFARADFPDDLEEIAAAIEEVVEQNADQILLIYVDVIEFRGQHIRAFYEDMARRFQSAYAARFAERSRAGDFGDADPMIAVMVATRWLFYYYTVEKCFGVPMHFGMTPKQAVDEFIRLLRFGLLPRATATATSTRNPERRTKTPARKVSAKRSRPRGGKP
jgi:AcrR family transcriptional regulator